MSEYQYYEFAAIDKPLTRTEMAELNAFIRSAVLSIDTTDAHWIFSWTLEESEDDGSGWMRRLIPLRDELMRGDLRPLYLGWLAAGDALHDDVLEPEVPAGLTDLSPAQQALVEFLEIDLDLLEAASMASAAATAPHDEMLPISAWLDTWQTTDMQDVLKTITLGRGQEAERQVRSHYAAWLKAQRPASSGAPRRRVAELRELAQSSGESRRVREAEAHAKREAERRQKCEAELRRLMDTPDKYWQAASAQASRGSASGYEKTVGLLKVLAEGYALVAEPNAFERQLRRFLVPYAKRAALLRRLAEAGLWSG